MSLDARGVAHAVKRLSFGRAKYESVASGKHNVVVALRGKTGLATEYHGDALSPLTPLARRTQTRTKARPV